MSLPRKLITDQALGATVEALSEEVLRAVRREPGSRMRNRGSFLRQVAMEAEVLRRRRAGEEGATVVESDQAMAAHRDLVAASARAWDHLLSTGSFVADPIDGHLVELGDETPRQVLVQDEPPADRAPTAFITWARGTAAWTDTVRRFAMLLRTHRIDADVDLFHQHEVGIDWQRYGPSAIRRSDFTLICVSRQFRERWDGSNDPREGAGAARESVELKGMFDVHQDEFRRRVLLVLLPGAAKGDVPLELTGVPRFPLNELTGDAIRDLLLALTNDRGSSAPPLGTMPVLPTKVLDAGSATDTSMRRADNAAELNGELRTIEDAIRSLPPQQTGELASLPWVAARQELAARRDELSEALERLTGSPETAAPGTAAKLLNDLLVLDPSADLDAVAAAAFSLAAYLAEPFAEPRMVQMASGHERGGFDVRFQVVSVRWQHALRGGELGQRNHLVRSFLDPRGQPHGWQLVGQLRGLTGEALLAGRWRPVDPIDAQNLRRFLKEAARLVRELEAPE